MWKSRLTAASLLWILLLSSTAGWIGHDHDTSGAGNFACAEDHQTEQQATTESDGAWHTAGPIHEHHCLGCRSSSKRWLRLPSQGTPSGLLINQWEPSHPASTPRAAVLRNDGSLRGPPALA